MTEIWRRAVRRSICTVGTVGAIMRDDLSKRPISRPMVTVRPAAAFGAFSLGAGAAGAFAFGAVALGAFAIGRLSVGRARIGTLEIDELRVRSLRLPEEADR